MNIIKIFKNPYARIRTTYIIIISALVVNAIYFTDNTTSLVIQLIIAFAVTLHHLDDGLIKTVFINTQNMLKEDKSIFDKNVVVSETDLDGTMTYVNSNYIKTTGYTKDELLGSTAAIIRSKNTPDSVYKKLWKTLNENKTYTGIFKNKKKDGTPFWVDIHIAPIFFNNKKVGYKAIMFDITDKEIVQENLKHSIEEKNLKLQEQSSRFEFAINSSRDGFWDYDIVKKHFYLSDGWKKRLGFEYDETVKYIDYLSLMSQNERFEHHTAMHDLIEQYPNNLKFIHFRIRYTLITKHGEKLIIEDVGDIFFDNREPIRITGFHRDITEQERQSKMIESQNRISEMGNMMSNIAHQWRQPIGAINNTLNDIEFDIELEDIKNLDSKIFLETSSKIKEYTAYLSQTIDDFRKFTSDDKQKTNFMIRVCIEQAYSISKKEFENNNINFHIIESGNAPSELNSYNRELQQVIINMLNNAKDILIERKIDNPTVTISIINNDLDITIIVHDNAGGIPDSILEKIFDPYFTTKHESIGTGIGLYMSRKIIIEHFNGTIEVENENNGAKFSIILPKE